MGQLESQERYCAWCLTKEGNHRKAAVLELCLLQLESPVAVLRGQVQGVKVAACARQFAPLRFNSEQGSIG